LDARFAIGKTVAQETEIADEIGSRRNGMVHVGIKCVVDRHTQSSSGARVTFHHRIAATVGEHDVVFGDRATQVMVRGGTDRVKGRWCIYVPIDANNATGSGLRDGAFQLRVEHTNPTRLDEEVRTPGGG